MEFDYDGGGLAKGGDVQLYIDGEQVGSGRVDATVPMFFSLDETTDLGEKTPPHRSATTTDRERLVPSDSHSRSPGRWPSFLSRLASLADTSLFVMVGYTYRAVFTLVVGVFVIWALYGNKESQEFFEGTP